MPSGTVSEQIPASSAEVFSLLHDYERRLEWDTLLQSAHLEGDFRAACLGATSVCTGKWYLGGIALRTRYVAFRPPELAAVEMVNRPPFFESFAASIRHQDLSPNESSATYRFTFSAKPGAVRFLIEPVMSWIFRMETRNRLKALRNHFSHTSRQT